MSLYAAMIFCDKKLHQYLNTAFEMREIFRTRVTVPPTLDWNNNISNDAQFGGRQNILHTANTRINPDMHLTRKCIGLAL